MTVQARIDVAYEALGGRALSVSAKRWNSLGRGMRRAASRPLFRAASAPYKDGLCRLHAALLKLKDAA
ncbi:hypothetical protein [Aquabacter cavernae]|uniref:hypothetical protein n=1 Tax=Aquabacter cavernae TaxID=2496029 RepID=UPI000F8D1351|nr:hypothetical protein [Aquabacter cavernae]